MIDIDQLFWNADIDEIKQGYVYNDESKEYVCLICGKAYEKGVIYPHNDMLYDAEKAVNVHVVEAHETMFEYLLDLDKRLTGISDIQKKLLGLFYKGYSDKDIAAEMDGSSTSTIRNHRFILRQKEKQAKIFLCLMELLKESKKEMKQEFVDIHKTATMIDDRYDITEEENQKILKAYFKEGLEGPLNEFPVKEKRKLIVLKHISKVFEYDKEYTEKEVNEILKRIYDDYATIRRYLIGYGFMERHKDGSLYWLKK